MCAKAATTTAVTTTRSTFKIEDPSLGPGTVDFVRNVLFCFVRIQEGRFKAPDGGFRLKGAPEPKIRRDPSQNSWNLVCGPPLYLHSSASLPAHGHKTMAPD